MKQKAFETAETLRNHTVGFRLAPSLWDEFDVPDDIMQALEWNEIKFLNDTAEDFSDEIDQLPDNHGGIYLFMIKSPVIPETTNYLAYIGRAQLTENHSLRVRCKKYFREYLSEKERPKITTMFQYYKANHYLRYASVEDNDLIIELESKLINSILLPFNDFIP